MVQYCIFISEYPVYLEIRDLLSYNDDEAILVYL